MILDALTFSEREAKTPLWLNDLRKLRISLLTKPLLRTKGRSRKIKKTKLEKMLSLMTLEQKAAFESGKTTYGHGRNKWTKWK